MFFAKAATAAALCVALTCAGSASAQTSGAVKIGLLGDFSSVYSDIGGMGNVEAVKMAIEDMGGTMFGRPIEFIHADVQNKADIAASLARRWYENEGVDMIIDLRPRRPHSRRWKCRSATRRS